MFKPAIIFHFQPFHQCCCTDALAFLSTHSLLERGGHDCLAQPDESCTPPSPSLSPSTLQSSNRNQMNPQDRTTGTPVRLSPPRHQPPPLQPLGSQVLQHWIPFEAWPRIASYLTSISDLKSFQQVCAAAYHAVALIQIPRQKIVKDHFHPCQFRIPDHIVDRVLTVHVVPPAGDSLILFLDESDNGNGIELAWLKEESLKRVALGLETVPANTVSNIRFSPDGSRIALLVTLAHGTLIPEDLDPLHRLRGWEPFQRINSRNYDINYDPCEDCTVQIVDLENDENGIPADLVVHTFSHVFVPEYGFDMVWRGQPEELELAFAAMLHSSAGAATYLVRWKSFHIPNAPNYVFMACIDGASIELLHDKRWAMLTLASTICTSRIEIGNDAKFIFFDTMSKFGILRFDQVVEASTSRVTRADLPNNPKPRQRRAILPGSVGADGNDPCSKENGSKVARALKESDIQNRESTSRKAHMRFGEDVTRISRMSPDGTLLCSVVSIRPNATSKDSNGLNCSRHIEMRSSLTGRLIYRRMIVRPRSTISCMTYTRVPFEKSGDIAQRTICFSEDSSLLHLWDTHLSNMFVFTSKNLPLVVEAKSGRLIQDFRKVSSKVAYEQIQMAPDGLTLYGTRMRDSRITMDAIDVLTGTALKTVVLTEAVNAPKQFLPHAVYMLPDHVLLTVARGNLDALWETTRGSLGCGWSVEDRIDPRNIPAEDQENVSPL